MTIKELREKRAKINAEAQELLKKDLTKEEEVRFDKMMDEADELKAQIDREERATNLKKQLDEHNTRIGTDVNLGSGSDSRKDREAAENEAFRSWLRYGDVGLTSEQRTIMARRMTMLPDSAEVRDLGVGTGAAGGFTVPTGFRDTLEVALKAYGGMRAEATVITTEAGNSLPMPTVNDTTNTGEWLSENTAASNQDIAFGQTTLGAYIGSSKLVPISLPLLQDSGIPVEQFVAEALASRLGRLQNAAFTVGTGTGQPKGVVLDATLGKTGTTGQTTSVIYDDLVDLLHALDPAYRNGAKFMMHDQTLRVVKKLKDSTGRPLWVPGISENSPDTLLGYEIAINQDVAQMAANAKSIMFGNFKKYFIRDVRGITVQRLSERYAEKLQVGFLAWLRVDGRLLNAGGNPVQYYANSAT